MPAASACLIPFLYKSVTYSSLPFYGMVYRYERHRFRYAPIAYSKIVGIFRFGYFSMKHLYKDPQKQPCFSKSRVAGLKFVKIQVCLDFA